MIAPKGSAARRAYLALGVVLTVIGAAGLVLPLLPGTPILILATACFARSSPRLEAWLLAHPQLGPGVRRWRERGAISIRSKIVALTAMTLSAVIVASGGAPLFAKVVVFALMGAGALFVATRPSG